MDSGRVWRKQFVYRSLEMVSLIPFGNTIRYDERVKVSTGGTPGKPIAFMAMPRRIGDRRRLRLGCELHPRGGFEITADKPATAVQLRGSHCEVLDNYVHDMMTAVNGTYGEPSPDGTTRDYSAVTHNRIAYNKVYHCEYGFILGGNEWLVENNEVSRLFMYAPGISEPSNARHWLSLLSFRLASRMMSSIWNGGKRGGSFSNFARHFIKILFLPLSVSSWLHSSTISWMIAFRS